MKLIILTIVLSCISLVYGEGRIVGGRKASIEEFPWQISLEFRRTPICGGSILDKHTVITAAHCTNGKDAPDFRIRAGSTYNNDGGVVIDVVEKIEHENYDPDSYDNDVTILKLKEPLSFDETKKPVLLPRAPFDENTPVNVSGWGLTDSNNDKGETELRMVEVQLISIDNCAEKYSVAKKSITKQMTCAMVEGGSKDACQGDSGGPLVHQNTLVGVVSWGIDCADEKFPGVYADVLVLKDWIEDKLEKVVEDPPIDTGRGGGGQETETNNSAEPVSKHFLLLGLIALFFTFLNFV